MLTIHRAERTDALVEALADVLAQPQADAFAREIVAVPTRGVERWLSQRLSHRLGRGVADDGVCAGVDFPSPSRLVAEALAAAGGRDPRESPWAPARLQWSVLDALDGLDADSAAAAVVGRYLARAAGTDFGGRTLSHRRLVTAAALARLFDSYAAQRPAMVLAWAEGADHDGTGADLPADLAWQCEVWRAVRRALGVPSPAEELPGAAAALAAEPDRLDLPPRLSVFGPTRLSTAELSVLGALAAGRDVHLWLPHPSPSLWARTADALASVPPGALLRAEDPTRDLARFPLLESLGRDARELQVRLARSAAGGDVHHAAPPRPRTLLGRLQDALADDRAPDPEPIDPDDFSVQVHACHGLPRQVEVLRELLVGLLDDDPTLQPRDIVVMCPDVERAAPLVAAALGRSAVAGTPYGHPGQRLRVRVADRSLLQVNPLLSLLSRLLDLADARLTRDEVLDLAAAAPVRHRFGLHGDRLERLAQWLPAAGVRWGLDEDHRAQHALPGVAANTWRAGLDRLLLGVAMSEDGLPLLGGVLPLDDVPSGDVDLAGRLAELVDRLDLVLADLRGPQPLTAWVAALGIGLDLLAEVEPADQWQDTAARRLLADVVTEAGDAASSVPLCLPDVRALLADRLVGRPTRANFRTGDLTVCSLQPMRSVPHRVVCLLGLDDDAYPRTGAIRGDDVLARRPFVGDREIRSEDRQILLDAVHAATERLFVLYTGMNPRTNVTEQPAVPVGELVGTLVRLAAAVDDAEAERAARARIEVRHPLQPFDERNHRAAGPDRPVVSARPRPFSYDPAMLAAAERARAPREAVTALRDLRLPPDDRAEVELRDLVAMLQHPAKAFLKQRLRMRPPDEDRPAPARIALGLGPLEQWAIGDRVVRQLRRGYGELAAREAETVRGDLTPGDVGLSLLDGIVGNAEVVRRTIEQTAPRPGASRPVRIQLPDGRGLVGVIPEVVDRNLVLATYSRLGPRHHLAGWVHLLALTVAEPDTAWTAVLVGKSGLVELGPVPPDAAAQVLAMLLGVHDTGLTRILPFAPSASFTYANTARGSVERARVSQAERAAEFDWNGKFGESTDLVHRAVWGRDRSWVALLGCAADPPTGSPHPTWFAELAYTVWEPLRAGTAR